MHGSITVRSGSLDVAEGQEDAGGLGESCPPEHTKQTEKGGVPLCMARGCSEIMHSFPWVWTPATLEGEEQGNVPWTQAGEESAAQRSSAWRCLAGIIEGYDGFQGEKVCEGYRSGQTGGLTEGPHCTWDCKPTTSVQSSTAVASKLPIIRMEQLLALSGVGRPKWSQSRFLCMGVGIRLVE